MIKCDPKAFMKCPVRMKHCKTEEEAYFCDGSDCHKFNQKILAAPKTNADRIRAMSDEELAEWLGEHLDCINCQVGVTCVHGNGCPGSLVDWLKQPAEDDNG